MSSAAIQKILELAEVATSQWSQQEALTILHFIYLSLIHAYVGLMSTCSSLFGALKMKTQLKMEAGPPSMSVPGAQDGQKGVNTTVHLSLSFLAPISKDIGNTNS